MAIAVLHRTRIAGVASAVPKHVVSNSDFTVISEEKRERVIKYTGIRYRRIATGDLCCSDLCEASAQKLMAELGWKPADIDVVIMVSQTCDYAFPTTAQLLQARLGLPKSCLALDVNLGCSGYPYGIFILGRLLEASGLKRGLLLVGDASKLPIGSDPASAVLFGHAGTATAIESSENSNPIFFEMGSDGGGHKVIYSPAGGARNPVSAASFEKVPLETGGARMDVNGVLDAAEIMNFTLREVPVSVRRLLENAGKTVA